MKKEFDFREDELLSSEETKQFLFDYIDHQTEILGEKLKVIKNKYEKI